MKIVKLSQLLLLFLLLTAGWSSDHAVVVVQEAVTDTVAVQIDTVFRLRLIFAGDLMGHTPVHEAALQEDGSYDYTACFKYVKDYVQSADLAIANLEVTLAGPPYTGYPQFSAPISFATAAWEAGFDILTTANNHCMDRGKYGLEATLRNLDSLGIPHFGTYRDTQQRMAEHPMLVERNGIRVALLCYTYGTNGIPAVAPNIVNDLDTLVMLRDLQVAEQQQADYVIALVHWGIEYQTQANASQIALARWLMEHGCDAVIGGHPHVVQNFTADINPENGRYPELVVFSMGNLISNQRKLNCDGGIMVSLELEKKGDSTILSDYSYLPYWVNKFQVEGKWQYRILPSADAVEFPEEYGVDENGYKALKLFDDNTRSRLHPADSLGCMPETRFYYRRMVSDSTGMTTPQ